jgi:hypothetical protein
MVQELCMTSPSIKVYGLDGFVPSILFTLTVGIIIYRILTIGWIIHWIRRLYLMILWLVLHAFLKMLEGLGSFAFTLLKPFGFRKVCAISLSPPSIGVTVHRGHGPKTMSILMIRHLTRRWLYRPAKIAVLRL